MKALEIQDLVLALQGKEHFRVEDIVKELGCSPGDVHRILLKLLVNRSECQRYFVLKSVGVDHV